MKNVILVNNRSLHFYDFEELKKNYDLRISAVIFQETYNSLSVKTISSLDHIYVLPNAAATYSTFQSFHDLDLDFILNKELEKFPNTWIVGADEINSLSVARLRTKYALKGTSERIIERYRNKFLQKKMLLDKKINTPKFISLTYELFEKNTASLYDDIIRKVSKKFIIKPNNMCASIGVERIESFEQLKEYLIKFKVFYQFIIEEFIEGQLYHCDFIVRENKYFFTEVCEYLHDGLSFISGYNHGSLILLKNDPLRLSIINFCQKVNEILGLQSGCGHFEVFVKKSDEIVFLEAAARPAGSIVPLIYNKTFKDNYLNAALLAEIEEIPTNLNISDKYYFWSFFPQKKGVIKNLKLPLLESVYESGWFAKIGDLIDESSSISDKSGFILAENKDYNVLRKDFYSLREFEALEMKSDL